MKKIKEEDEIYTLTPWGCLYAVLLDYGIHVDVTPTVGTHMVEDFMKLMEKSGHVTYVDKEGEES